MNKKKIISPLLTPVLVGVLVITGLLNLLVPDQGFSQTENRTLTGFPAISLQAIASGDYWSELNSWFSDQFVGRDTLFHLNYLIQKTIGNDEIDDVFLSHGCLQQNPSLETDSSVSQNLEALSTFAANSGLPVNVMVVPGSAMVQKDRLPFSAPVNDQTPYLDAIASQAGITPVDVRSVLADNSSDYIYYRTDHHMTTKGAGLTSQALLASMGIDMSVDQYSIMPVSTSFQGTLAGTTGSVWMNDEIDIAVSNANPQYVVTWADGSKTGSIYQLSALNQKDQYEVFLGANQSIIHIDTNADSDMNLLIFKDSYANNMIQYLLPYCKSITIIDPRYFYDDLDLVLSTYQINQVAAIFSADTFVTQTSLKNVLDTYTVVSE